MIYAILNLNSRNVIKNVLFMIYLNQRFFVNYFQFETKVAYINYGIIIIIIYILYILIIFCMEDPKKYIDKIYIKLELFFAN